MSTSFRGAPGSSGHAGLRSGPGQPVSRNHTTPGPVLTRLGQPSQEQLLSSQIRKLTVRLLTNVFDSIVHDAPCYQSSFDTLLDLHEVRSYLIVEMLTDVPAETTCDKGKDRRRFCAVGPAGLGGEQRAYD